MANKTDPLGKTGLTANLLPNFYQTIPNKKFLQATLDQLYQPGALTKVNGFIGRENAKAATGKDIYVTAVDPKRQQYQLEPGIVIKDSLKNITFFKDYIDYVNQIGVFGGNTSNHARLNKQEFYSWDPHIDWDKFTNFQNYYWVPYGPDTIKIYGQPLEITSSYTVELQDVGSNNQYVFTPDGFSPNPPLKLYKGHTYTFNITSPGNPFSFMTKRSTGVVNRYITGNISNYGVTNGSITFTIPLDAPSVLYYQSETDIDVGGSIEIFSINDDTFIDVEKDFLGKATYKLTDGTLISNGMKVSFGGNVNPVQYADGEYYVEGVGTAIKLVSTSVLEIITPYTVDQTVEFASDPFGSMPFSNATGFASEKDYITINRASRDRNPWSRYNRWFHKDVINTSALYNKSIPSLNQLSRANRPIIEFTADLKLFNFGTYAIPDVDLIDNFTDDIFSKIEGSIGYSVDGVSLIHGHKILVTADTDPLVVNKIYQVEFIDVKNLSTGSKQIHLVEIAQPLVNECTIIRSGVVNQSLTYWFNGTTWVSSQQKTNTNQSPLFDVVDDEGISYGDTSVYSGSTFSGTTLFSYKVGTGLPDKVLGFPLTYQNVSNIGDIVFDFNFAIDTFQYKQSTNLITVQIERGYLLSQSYSGNTLYQNGWQVCKADYIQAALRIYNNSNLTNNFDIDIFDASPEEMLLDQDDVRVYINAQRVAIDHWSLVTTPSYYQVVLKQPVELTDIVTLKVYSTEPINSTGYYEIPINLQNNPLNDVVKTFTLGEVVDHVNSIIDNVYNPKDGDDANGIDNLSYDRTVSDINGVTFIGVFPGTSNLRDLGNITQYGTKFVQHSGPLSLSLYHITSQSTNVIKAIETSRDDYGNFKRKFIAIAASLGVDASPVVMVDLILQKINENYPTTAPYYFSDMVPYGASIVSEIDVVDYRIKQYPLSTSFNLDVLSNKSVCIYQTSSITGTSVTKQLIHGRDYTFNLQDFYIDDSVVLNNGDILTTYEYDNTDGSFVPSTPTKLGMWPAYVPQIYLDTTLITPKNVIQGHDGSIILAYNDYRDALILELESRIYNNIKVKYNPEIFDITEIVPSYSRTTAYSLSEYNNVLAPSFYKWTGLIGSDFSKPINYNVSNPFTYNYSDSVTPDGTQNVPGYWRGIYRWILDTDRPNLCPWEMLGFSVRPQWWISLYGPAPYTSDNLPMWQDISLGAIREPGKPVFYSLKFAKPFLMQSIPVDGNGNLKDPNSIGLAKGMITPSPTGDYVFGDVAPVEAAWRRSSHYPFSVITASMLLTPAKTFGTLIDRSRIVRNRAGQIVYKDTGLRVRPIDIKLPNLNDSKIRVQTAGIINYVVDLILNYIFSNNIESYNDYANDLSTMAVQLSYRVGSFTNRDQFKLLLESKTPLTSGSIFVPPEDYDVFLNTSSPATRLTYSGVRITKLQTGYQIQGYSRTQPYFKYYNYLNSGTTINIGGISHSYAQWTSGEEYLVGNVVVFDGRYYSTIVQHTADDTFNSRFFQVLTSLPVTGGVSAAFRTTWDKTELLTIPYGTELTTVQDVVDFLLGYEQYLIDQGFTFDTYNNNLGVVSNWSTSAKEFMFWTTQNWSAGQDKWNDWLPNKPIAYGTIIRYEGEYYSALTNVPSSPEFNPDDFNKLEGLSVAGAGVISLSPSAASISFKTSLTVVDDVSNKFNDYEIFKVDGTPITPNQLDSYRTGNLVTYTPRTSAGIYCASFYLIQHEHVIIINNTDIFNDIIYNPPSGYRRERIKVSGYITADWYGGLDIPGFIFDAATVKNWQPWKDYNMGDIIAYQGYNYSANTFLPGTSTFESTSWTQLAKAPASQILPNWTNLATQFTDFYSLEVDNFDSQQQKIAQHLIGYQSRQYLSNIIQEPVSEFKFYQGMIREKGTQNVLNKLFNVLSSGNEESLTFYEEWALRVGQYGASEAFENIEFILDEDKFKNNPQGVLLLSKATEQLSPVIIQQTANDVYLKPQGYSSMPFPAVKTYQPLLRSAGYVNPSDVFVTVGSLDELITKDITTFENGAYIWVTFDSPKSQFWNVYRFTDTSLKISEVTYNSNSKLLTLTSDNIVNFVEGSYIGISQVAGFSGFYKVESVTLNTFVVSADLPSWKPPFTQQASINIFVLTSQRAANMDSIGTILTSEFSNDELIWVDNTVPNDGKWATWKFNQVYSKSDILNEEPSNLLGFGKILDVTAQGDLLAVGDNAGAVTIYYKSGTTSSWSEKQVVPTPNVWGTGNLLPSSIKFSPDGTWLAVGSKYAGSVSSSLSSHNNGIYDLTRTYSSGSIVIYNNRYYKTEKAISPLYTSMSGAVTVSSSGAIFDVVVVPTSTSIVDGETVATNGYYDVKVRYGGVGYKVGGVIKILGTLLGGISPSDDLTVNVATVNSVNGIATISNLQGVPSSKSNSVLLAKTKANVSGIVITGTGALFNVATNNGANLESYSIPSLGIISGGSGYLTGDKFIISGSMLGGEDIINDLTITVTAPSGAITGYSAFSGNTAWTRINYLPAAITAYGTNVQSGSFGKGNTYQISSLGTTELLTDFRLIGTATKDSNGNALVWSNVRLPRIGDFFVATNTGAVKDGSFVVGKQYIIVSPGTTNFALVGATGTTPNAIGTIFTATAVGSSGTPGSGVAWQGTGTATEQINATESIYQQQGVVTLYKKDNDNFYSVVDTIISLNPTNYEQFGSNLEFGNDTLYISANGYANEAGRVYTLFYQTTDSIFVYYNPVGSFTSTEPTKLVISSSYAVPVSNIRIGMTVHGIGFTSDQYVVEITGINTVILNAPPDSTPDGQLTFKKQGWTYNGGQQIISGTAPDQGIGIDVKISKDNSTLAISTYTNIVKIYKRNSTTGLFVFLENITGTDSTFGQGLDVSDDGTYIAISDYALNNRGVVNVYKLTNNSYNTVLPYVITNQFPQSFASFGSKIAFMNDYKTLVIYSEHGDTSTLTTLDGHKTRLINSQVLYNNPYVIDQASLETTPTTFDKDSTNFVTKQPSSGRVDIYDVYATKWVFSESLTTSNTVTDGYGTGVAVCNNQIIVSAPYAQDKTFIQSGLLYSYVKPEDTYSWTVDCTGVAIANVKKIKQAFLYNKASGTLLKYLDVIDPGQGKITGPADAEIQYKAYYDPAVYSYSTTDAPVNSDPTTFWTTTQVGKIWWNLGTTKFVNAYLDDVTYRNNSWNTLAEGASVDIYEWVQTKLLPADWDKQADTPAGLALGISGISLYGNNAYSVTQKYNNITKKLVNTYYFWVKNKNVVPTTPNRHISALQVSKLISNPRGEAYTYLALIGTDSFSLVNARSYLADKDVVLSIEYWLTDKTDQNVHSQWSLISNDINVDLPITIEQKWFDSLCGVDLAGRLVPDTKQPPKLRYGIENRPRQSMFVNRIEALKQFIERVNITLQQNQITEGYNLTKLESYDTTPTTVTGLYDQIQDTDTDLSYININSFRQAKLSPVIVNGVITKVNIDFEGSGYGIAPSVEIIGTGKNAQVTTVITNGKITEVIVRNGGIAYDDSNTTLVVRSYSVLINSDNQANGNWSIYSWTPSSTSTGAGAWSRILTQAYDVRKYWNYTDWYATGYNQYSSADYLVSTFVGLNDITPAIGELVKVTTVNSGGWLLLEKYANSTSVDWTQSYQVVGIQNGTIQLSSKLYNFVETDIGYDSDIFDNGYDIVASIELRVILNAIKDDIFIGDLKQQYLDLFIASIKYAHSEQVFIDWAFKTSFVRATHNVGQLDQPVNYPVDNISDFENYVNEVKPYRTKLREYISNYKNLDIGPTAVSDFDLQPLYTDRIVPLNTIVANGKIDADNSAIQNYPWKFWLDNVGFVVTDIVLVDGGSNYVNPPLVVFSGDSGSGVEATAYISNGVVNRIILTSTGSGYLSAPTITLVGGVGIGGTSAKAVTIIGNSVVRSSLVGIKFDRTSNNYYITQLEQTETFTGTGSKIQFALKWAPDVTIGTSIVTVAGVPVLRELYSLSIVKKKIDGNTQYTGIITFENAPANGAAIKVVYIIDKSVMSATDRIQYYYNPVTGQLGKELSQLMLGVDYGGVQVNGLGFSLDTGWGTTPYYSDKWDNFDSKFTDYFVTVAANVRTFDQLPYVADLGTEINVYKTSTSTDTHVSDGLQTKYTYNILADKPVVTLVNNIETTSIATIYQPTGSYYTTLKVANTIVTGKNILPGMAVIGNGFTSGQTVTSVVDGQTLTLSAAPDSNPANRQFLNLTGTNQNNILGSGATFNVVTTENGYSAQVVTGGTGYSVSLNFGSPNTIKILGTAVGGSTPLNDVTLAITSVGDSSSGLPGMIISVTAVGTPSVVPLAFTFNYPGSNFLTLKNTAGLSVTDVITCPSVTRLVNNKTIPSIAYGTVIKSIDTVNNKVGLGTFDPITSLNVIGVSGTGTKVTMTFSTQPAIPYPVNSLISITGFIPNKYNGIYTVTDATTSSMSFSSTVSALVTTYGTITTVIDSILFQAIPNNSTVVFTKTLKESLEVNIFEDGTINLLINPVPPVGTNVVITGTINPVRLDDPKFGTSNQKNSDAIMQTPFPVLSTTVTGAGRYTTMPTVTISPSDLNAPLYTATASAVMTAVDVSYNGNNNGTGYRVGDILVAQPTSGVTPAVMNNSIITNNMLTVGTVASGTVQVGMVLSGSGIAHRQSPIITTGASCDTSTGTVTLTFASLGASFIPFAIGQSITVAGISPSAFNGVYNVTAATTTTVSYAKVVTLANFIAKIGNLSGTGPGNRLVVTTVSSGTLEIGQTIVGTGVAAGTIITDQVSGTTGSTGVYIVSNNLLFVNSSTYMNSSATQTTPGTVTSNAITYITGNISGSGAGSKWTVNLKQTTALVGNNTSTTVTGAGAVVFEVTRVASNAVPPVGPITTVSIVSSTSFTGSLNQNNQQLIGGSGQNGTISIIYGVQSLTLTNSGSGYLNNPTVTISSGLQTATATATIQQFTSGLPRTIVSLPNSYTVNAGDEFILRKSTSDGSIAPPTQDFDTAISGGDLAYSTATGIAADDIVIDGDGLVTPTTSPAPEEVVPGQVVDTLAIKVYDQSASGSAKIKVDSYVGNGSTATFKINQQMNSTDALIVRLGNIVQERSDYTVNFQNNTVSFNTTPSTGTVVSIFSLSPSGNNVLDNDYFIGDGVTTEFVTKANWTTNSTSLVYINGVTVNPVLFKTDSTYDLSNAIGFRFPLPPAKNDVISYIITSGIVQNFAINQRQVLVGNGTRTYNLANPIGESLPVEQSMIVIVDNSVLKSPLTSYFIVGNGVKTYTPDFWREPFTTLLTSVKVSEIGVYLDGKKLSLSSDYTVDTSNISVTILNNVYKANIGKKLSVTVEAAGDYTINPVAKTITFKSFYNSSNTIEILSSYNQKSLDIERTSINMLVTSNFEEESVNYHYVKDLSRSVMKLDRPVLDSNYVWVFKNTFTTNFLLAPGVDYVLLEDKQTIQLAANTTGISDVSYTLMTFGNNTLSSNISYMQFKDMLNRVIYKRLSKDKQTRLARDLYWNDVEIVVEDASNFDIPNISTNRPGIVEIRGERIEFFAISGNTLKQIRRGTLGTGIYTHNKAGTFVQDIGTSSTVPYADSTTVQNIIADGVSSSYAITLGATLNSSFTNYNSLFEVFVGGDNDTVRLKKSSFSVFDVNRAPYSPLGDVIFPAEFTISNVTTNGALLTLTNPVTQGTKITVVRVTGHEWDGNKNNPVNILDSDGAIASFIKATPGIWYSGFNK
jgi:hypothetical protein